MDGPSESAAEEKNILLTTKAIQNTAIYEYIWNIWNIVSFSHADLKLDRNIENIYIGVHTVKIKCPELKMEAIIFFCASA